MLKIADNLSLPVDVVTQAIGILAIRRAGKSYTARRLVEQLYHAKQQIVIVDPKGDWWGIRSSVDGKSAGLEVPILGGEHGDIPLESGAGEVVAKMAVEEGVSLLLDLSMFRKHEVATFMTAFLENLYRLKAKEAYRTAMMLMIDEADAIAPQRPPKGEERMLGAAEDIVRRGGQRGIGCTMVTQRSAVLNKNVLTQIQILVAMRTISPQDLAAEKAWIEVHGTLEQQKILMESLPSLPTGDAWFWSPGWPSADGIFKHVHVLPIETFDSGATPKAGEHRVEAKTLADVDLKAFEKRMAATIERAKADDPKELRRQIAELRKQLATKPQAISEEEIKKRCAQAVSADRRFFRERLKNLRSDLDGIDNQITMVGAQIGDEIDAMTDPDPDGPDLGSNWGRLTPKHPEKRAEITTKVAPHNQRRILQPSSNGNGTGANVGGGPRRILVALAQHQGESPRARNLAAYTGLSERSVQNYLIELRQAGYAVGGGQSGVEPTMDGIKWLGDFDPLPTGPELREWWLRELSGGPRAIFELVSGEKGARLKVSEISDATGLAERSVQNYLIELRAKRIVEGGGSSGVKASDELFE